MKTQPVLTKIASLTSKIYVLFRNITGLGEYLHEAYSPAIFGNCRPLNVLRLCLLQGLYELVDFVDINLD